jgi:ubiquinone/menaquinone biosynthesis C-methylase UbiE
MNERTFHAHNAKMLDDPERLRWLPPDQVIQRIGLRPGMAIADVGAGTGYFALPFSRVVGADGSVHAVDFQKGMLEHIRGKLNGDGDAANISLVFGAAAATNLPGKSVDLVFMANLWHELDDLSAVLAETARILRKGGTLAVVDWRADLPSPPGPPSAHRVSVEALLQTLRSSGWKVEDSGNIGLYSHYVVARLEPGA